MQEHVKRFGQTRCRERFALDDSFVGAGTSGDIIGLDGEDLLEHVCGTVCLECPYLHLSESLAAELRFTAERLLGDEAVRTDRTGVHLVIYHVTEFHEVGHADGRHLVERLACLAVVQLRLAAARKTGFVRPFVQLNEYTATGGTPTSDPLRYNGSYPSGHACASWLYALVMAEVAPDYEEALLNRAFQYGNGRVVTGYHWQSDVDMGRLVGAAAYARMHTKIDFMEQLELAQKEFKNASGVRGTKVDEGAEAPIYDLKGIRVNSTPSSGIYIQGNKKIMY